jgi:hypothetical protein
MKNPLAMIMAMLAGADKHSGTDTLNDVQPGSELRPGPWLKNHPEKGCHYYRGRHIGGGILKMPSGTKYQTKAKNGWRRVVETAKEEGK